MSNYKGWSKWYSFEDLYTFNGLVHPKSKSGMVTTIDTVKGGLAQWNGFSEIEGSDIYFKDRNKLESPAEIPCGIYMLRIKGKLPEKDPPKSGFYDYIGLAGGIMNSSWRSNGFNSRIPDDHFRKLINIPKRGDVIAAIKKAYPNDVPKRSDAIAALAKQNLSYKEYRDFFKGNYSIESNFKIFFECNQERLGSTKDVQDFFNSNVRIRFNFLKRNLRDSNDKYIRYENIYKIKGKLRNEVLQGNKKSLEESKIYYNNETNFLERLNKAEGLSLQAYFTKYKEYPFLNDRDEVTYALEGFENILDED